MSMQFISAADRQKESESKRKKALEIDGQYVTKAENSISDVVPDYAGHQSLGVKGDQLDRTSLETWSSQDPSTKAQDVPDQPTVPGQSVLEVEQHG